MTSKEQSLVGECKMFPRNDNFVGIVLLINDRCLGGGIFFFFFAKVEVLKRNINDIKCSLF